MRRNKTHKAGRIGPSVKFRIPPVLSLSALLACGFALLAAGFHPVALRSADLSATETVALRFPDNWDDAPAVPRVLIAAIAGDRGSRGAQLGLFSPEPMSGPPPAAPPRAEAMASLQDQSAASPPARQAVAPVVAPFAPPVKEARTVPAPRRVINRPGYMLNETQIASIKARLHLTADQERMWPTVEAALRNMAYAHAQDGRGRAANQTASVDPESVQGLKSAAVPLILSFNTEQKEEVRNIVHVMGLDQLASQF